MHANLIHSLNRSDGVTEWLVYGVLVSSPGYEDAWDEFGDRYPAFDEQWQKVRAQNELEANQYKWEKKLPHIQSLMDEVNPPRDIGRIVRKIKAQIAGLTAAQIKNFHMVYGPLMFQELLHPKDYAVWVCYAQACRILDRTALHKTDVSLCKWYLQQFCWRFELRYNNSAPKPNMHMHGHLHECIEDYGPPAVYELWSFEAFNGIIKDVPNNGNEIALTVMRAIEQTRVLHNPSEVFRLNPALRPDLPLFDLSEAAKEDGIKKKQKRATPIDVYSRITGVQVANGSSQATNQALAVRLLTTSLTRFALNSHLRS